MTFPKHKNPSNGNEATAPYNFVPLPDEIETLALEDLPPHDSYDSKRHTGRIEVKLTTASPLYIRGGLSPALFAKIGKEPFNKLSPQEKQQVAQFFHTHTNPVIPGSSLRGMLRSMVEIVSYGKVAPVSDKQLVYRAIGKQNNFTIGYRNRLMLEEGGKQFTPLLKAGYIEKRGLDWFIRPAQEINGVTFSRILINNVPRDLPRWYNIKNAHKIWFRPGPYAYKNVKGGFIKMKFSDALDPSAAEQDGLQAGVHIYSGRMNSKKFDRVVYPPDQSAKAIPISDDMVTSYREQISKEQISLLGRNGVLEENQPVFYLMEDDKLVFFGHTMMLRLPYLKTPEDFVPEELRQESSIDFAEAMFGYVKSKNIPKGKTRAYAGRIFVGDARLEQISDDIWLNDNPITPKILGGPKPTSFQLYLTQQGSEVQFSHYASPTPGEAVIRGHKLYWHRGENPAIENDNHQAGETQLTQIKPLKPDVAFTFTIRFENLSEHELGALCWILKLGADDNYRLKLGMGKPLGMGAVKTEPTLHLTNRQTRYQSLFNGSDWQKGTTNDDNTSTDKAADAFAKFIKDNHSDAFGGEGRIEQLRALLNWPGPLPTKTEYMQLKDFRAREVLPTPIKVHPHRYSPPPPVSAYKKFDEVRHTWQVTWNSSKHKMETTMPNGEKAIMDMNRKTAKKYHGKTEILVVNKIENGVCFLGEY